MSFTSSESWEWTRAEVNNLLEQWANNFKLATSLLCSTSALFAVVPQKYSGNQERFEEPVPQT